MAFVEKLYRTMPYILFMNAIVLIYKIFHQYKPLHNIQRTEPSWSWKDSLVTIIPLLSMVLICVLAILASKFLPKEIAIWVFMPIIISFYLQQSASFIPSVKTLESVISHNAYGKLSLKESAALLLLSVAVVVFSQFDIYAHIKAYAVASKNLIFADFILAASLFLWVSLPVFFICALAVAPLQLFIAKIKHLFRKNTWKRAKTFEAKIEKRLSGTIVNRAMIITLVEFWKQKSIWIKLPLCLVMPIAFILDIIHCTLSFLCDSLISIVWYSYQILKQLGAVFKRIAAWIISVSDRTIIATSFRLTIVVGLCATVIINRYEPFFLKQDESTAVLEFISSAIVIPVILEWIVSFKNRRKEAMYQG